MSPAAVRELARSLCAEEWTARRYTKGSRTLARIALEQFLRWTSRRSTPDLRVLARADLVAYHAWLARQRSTRTGEALAATTINGRFQVVTQLFACLYREGVIQENPAHGLHCAVPVPKVYRRRPLSRAEVDDFLLGLRLEGSRGLRDRCIFELIYSSGLRVGEAVRLTVGDIDLERRLMVVHGKFDRDRVVPVSEVARDFLILYLGQRIGDREAWVFPGRKGHLQSASLSERFRELLRRCGMDKPELSTHSLRHSTATHLLENGASIRHVQELLGHGHIESTARYTQVMSDTLALVYRRHHPREHALYEEMDASYQQKLASLET
jgi:integrase/recombinase XerD